MPYICQLCFFRTSLFEDVLDHFKRTHEGSSYLLCVYCLRVFRISFSSAQTESGFGATGVFYQHLQVSCWLHRESVDFNFKSCCAWAVYTAVSLSRVFRVLHLTVRFKKQLHFFWRNFQFFNLMAFVFRRSDQSWICLTSCLKLQKWPSPCSVGSCPTVRPGDVMDRLSPPICRMSYFFLNLHKNDH